MSLPDALPDALIGCGNHPRPTGHELDRHIRQSGVAARDETRTLIAYGNSDLVATSFPGFLNQRVLLPTILVTHPLAMGYEMPPDMNSETMV